MSRQSHFLEGIIIGTILGGVLGILFAPEEGKKTREKLREKTENKEEIVETAKQQTEDMIEKTKDAIEVGFAKVRELIEQNKESKGQDFESKHSFFVIRGGFLVSPSTSDLHTSFRFSSDPKKVKAEKLKLKIKKRTILIIESVHLFYRCIPRRFLEYVLEHHLY